MFFPQLPDWYHTLDFGAILLLYSNAAINPIIYAGWNENFRKGFKDLVNGVINRNSPSASEEFESEYKQRSTLRARDSRVAIVERCINGAAVDGNNVDADTDNNVSDVVVNGNAVIDNVHVNTGFDVDVTNEVVYM